MAPVPSSRGRNIRICFKLELGQTAVSLQLTIRFIFVDLDSTLIFDIYHHALVLETLVTNNDFKCSILLTILQFSILQSPLNLRCLLCLCIFVEIIAIYNICRCGKLAITLK